jgi:hypothetical protein
MERSMSVIEEEKVEDVPVVVEVATDPAESVADELKRMRMRPVKIAEEEVVRMVGTIGGGYMSLAQRNALLSKIASLRFQAEVAVNRTADEAANAEAMLDEAWAENYRLREANKVLNDAIVSMSAEMAAMGERLQAISRKGIIGALVHRANEEGVTSD